MATITTIAAGDLITNSRTDINTNFANLNSDKIETSVIDTDTALTANSDAKIPSQKAVKAYVDAGGNVNASTTVKGIVEEATEAEVLAGTTTGGSGARLFVNPGSLSLFGKKGFGGTGSDGALTITSGTTTIDLASAEIVYLNYTSISITGTGKLAFSNKAAAGTIVYIRCQGNVTITSSATPAIDLDGLGASGGALGNAGTDGFYNFGGYGAGGVASSGGVSPKISRNIPRQIMFGTGSGGGGSTDNGANNGTGGAGGGSLVIECLGALNFTGLIYARGIQGSAGGTGGSGGGGGGGSVCILYNTLTSNTGTITVTGGAGGSAGGTGSGDNGGGGGASIANNGNASNATTRVGGAGGDGLSIVASNLWF